LSPAPTELGSYQHHKPHLCSQKNVHVPSLLTVWFPVSSGLDLCSNFHIKLLKINKYLTTRDSSVNVVTTLRAERFETGIMTGGKDFSRLLKVQMDQGANRLSVARALSPEGGWPKPLTRHPDHSPQSRFAVKVCLELYRHVPDIRLSTVQVQLYNVHVLDRRSACSTYHIFFTDRCL